MMRLALVIVFAVALGTSILLTPLAGRIGARFGVVDKPRKGELQWKPISRTGGYAMILAFLIAVAVSFPMLPRFHEEYPRLIGLLLGIVLILPIAVVDDLKRLGPLPQLIGQFAIAAVPVAFGVLLNSISTPFGGPKPVPSLLIIPITLVWTVGMINTMNFTDTMDGLAGGIGLIGALVLTIVSIGFGQYTIAVLPAALAGAAAGFLVFNFPPARIFMGTSGSMFLGYTLALFAVVGGVKLATAVMVLGIPIADVASVIIYRALRGRSPFRGGDSAHLPHRLMAIGLKERTVVLLFYALCVLFGLLAIFLPSMQKLYGFVALGAAMSVILVFISLRGRAVVNGHDLPAHQPAGEHTPGEAGKA